MKSLNHKAIEFLMTLRKNAVKDGIRATKAVEMLIKKFPDISRAATYNSAEIAGINKLTARNVYDRVKMNEALVVIKDRRAGERRES